MKVDMVNAPSSDLLLRFFFLYLDIFRLIYIFFFVFARLESAYRGKISPLNTFRLSVVNQRHLGEEKYV
ncbi:hypothetical protein K450DRAFT_244508 [Umbelopsis ramanniana AG]|uniref:Uncharacterized protein n=1 Tax=Umbelopsis ramanniana AG TaxID=1314678 RepID=A0AAD5E942_UMBRA|nr:uncharacterized protein K450DRAFT_244508 [Umbelopsis ramanniana AG]KAI8578997.1 hypothetical protein K450DRAFT_244508 [Umbelopsis ramanniana AG]